MRQCDWKESSKSSWNTTLMIRDVISEITHPIIWVYSPFQDTEL